MSVETKLQMIVKILSLVDKVIDFVCNLISERLENNAI